MDQDKRIPLKILGVSIAEVNTGAHVLILEQIGGPYRIPVVIGSPEAKAIVAKMEGVTPPRPMTHDLFGFIGHAFGIKHTEVFIYRFEDGIFYSELTFTDGDRTITIDSRTSDAIAIAMRTGAPIFTTPEVLNITGFEMEIAAADHPDEPDLEAELISTRVNEEAEPYTTSADTPKLRNYAIEELERLLEELIAAEEYEKAASVAEIIAKKKSNR